MRQKKIKWLTGVVIGVLIAAVALFAVIRQGAVVDGSNTHPHTHESEGEK